MINEVERQQAEAALNDIAVRRAAVYQQHRGMIDPPPEFFGQLRALDAEALMWQKKLADTPEPEFLPQWGRNLWVTVDNLRLELVDFRDERRRERLQDMAERDAARRAQTMWFASFALVMAIFLVVLTAVSYEVWRP